MFFRSLSSSILEKNSRWRANHGPARSVLIHSGPGEHENSPSFSALTRDSAFVLLPSATAREAHVEGYEFAEFDRRNDVPLITDNLNTR